MVSLPRSTLGLTCVVLAALAAVGGCTKEIPIVQMPPFWTPELKTIAVVPFRNRTTGKDAGNIIADKLAVALMANGTYKVFNRNDLKDLMDQDDLRIAFGGDTAAAAGKFKQFTGVQAILTGAVTTYAATSQSQRKRDPQYVYRNGKQYLAGYKTYTLTRNEANVSATAALIRVSDGSTVYATPSPAKWMSYSQGSPPQHDPYACAAEAADCVVAKLVEAFAVVRKVIKVDPNKALRTATELYDNKWTESRTFPATADRMFVVVGLPASCDRNRFKITIVRKEQRQDLVTRQITWTRKHGSYGYAFSPKDIAAKGGGPGEYEVKFYSGPEPVLRRSFSIR